MLISEGSARIGIELFTELPPAGFEQGGGFGNAILGTLVMVAIASVISIPFGILGGVLLGFIAPDSRVSDATRFIAKVMTALPSILAGVFVYAWLVPAIGTYSAIAGGIALAALMLPTVLLSILIYNFSGMPFDNQIQLALAASLVLVLIVLVFNILSRIIGRRKV